ncbi:MAG: biosynthetic-type acetolactate synthase large subunit [Firmicutes bacterium]|nr:biosynthetic-type acetolactate synthase large subunit [Bacillota bacterium]
MTGAEYIAGFLVKKEVETLFGYPGASVLELYDAIASTSIRHILMRHEQGASHAAAGYAKASGKTGVCIATSGPGAANLVTGIADAYLDSAPMLIITGQVDTSCIGRDAFQEADILGITMPVTKHSYLIRSPEALKNSLEEAWHIAVSGRPGPVLIDIAHDIFTSELDSAPPKKPVLPRDRKNEFTLGSRIDEIVEAVSHSHRPIILAGGGVVLGKASHSLSRFAAESGIPIVTTLPGTGITIPHEYRPDVNILGMAGIYGTTAANEAMDQCDLVLAAGCRMSDRTLRDFNRFGRGRRIIHCDIDQAEINKNVIADIPVVCGAGDFFDALSAHNARPSADTLVSWNEYLRSQKVKPTLTQPNNILSCREILRAVDSVQSLRKDAVYVTDVGNHQMRAAQEIEPQFERGFITSAGLGVMGFGLPAAIGASFGVPSGCRQIIVLCGDGGFQMTMEELAVLHVSKLPIKIFLFDNSSLGMIRKMQDAKFGGRRTDSMLSSNPDFIMIAKAYGISSVSLDVSCRNNLSQIISEISDANENILVHCVTGKI